MVLALFCLLLPPLAHAQTGPHIGSLFPSGARAGQTVDVTFKGGGLIGIRKMLVSGGPGVSAEFVAAAHPIDETAQPLFQSKCTTCHEPRSPDNRSMTNDQWAATVSRMITQHGADISTTDRDKIVGYLQALASAGEIKARITVAPQTAPGLRELRLLTVRGVSSATSFEVGSVPEAMALKTSSGKPGDAQAVTLPVAVNGIVSQPGERDWFRFDARKGQRLTFNLKAQRLNAEEATYFFPTLYLYDSSGKELAKNLGKYGVDPLLDYVVPEDGSYLILVRDLLWHGTPGSVYRLTMGESTGDGVLSPAWARPGESVSARFAPASTDGADPGPLSAAFTIHAPTEADGMTTVATPGGDAPLLVRDLPDGGGPNGAAGATVALPALFRGEIAQPGQTDVFHVRAPRGNTALEIYAQRLGSPLLPQVAVKDASGTVVATHAADGEDDMRLPNAFPRAGDYTVEVTDVGGNGGPGYLYCWEASARSADLQLTATPDVANVSPGGSMALVVKAVRRRNVNAPITIRALNLPAGVTANDAVMLPGMTEAALVLTASPTAAPGNGGFITIEATADGSDQTTAAGKAAASLAASPPEPLRRIASPVEVFALGNQQIRIPRSTFAVAVQSQPPPFTLACPDIANGLKVAVGKDIKLTVNIQRQNGFKGAVFVSMQGLPPGITQAQQAVNLAGDKTQATIVLHVTRDDNQFKALLSPAGTSPLSVVIAGFVATLNNDFVATTTTPAIAVSAQ